MLFIGIPTYDGKLHFRTAQGLAQTTHLCAKLGVGVAIEVIPHDAFVGRARSTIAKRFLDSGAEDLLYVDADIGFTSAATIAVCRADADVVMALYRMKVPKDVRYPALMFDPIERHPKDDSLIRLQYGPAGFMRVRRHVIEKMVQTWPDEWFEDEANGRIHDLFPCGRKGNFFLGEDIAFCRRVQECGFGIYAVQGVELEHYGEAAWKSEWRIDIPQPVVADEREAA